MTLCLATSTPLVVPPACVGSPSQCPRSLWKWLGLFPCLFAVVLQCPFPRDLPHPCSLVADLRTGSGAQPGRGIMTCLLGWLPLASVSFWTVPWLVAHLSKLWEAELYGPPSLLCASRVLGGGSPHHGPWLQGAQCNPKAPAAVPRQQGWMEGCVLHLPPSPGRVSPTCVVQ